MIAFEFTQLYSRRDRLQDFAGVFFDIINGGAKKIRVGRKIHEVLGWKAEVSFEDGVAEMLTYLDDWKDAPVWEPDSIKKATAEWFEYLGDNE